MKTKQTKFGRRDFIRLSTLGAGSIVAAKALPKGVLCEIEAIAVIGEE